MQHIKRLSRCLIRNANLVSSRALHDHSRSHSKRGHRQNCDDHPLRTGVFGVHAQDHVLFIRNALEDLVDTFRAEENLLLLGVFIYVLPLSIQLQARATDTWLVSATASMTLEM